MIKNINEQFASTWILKEDLNSLANEGNSLAQTLAARYEHPVDLMFLTSEGRFVSKLNSFHDFPGVHPDVTIPPFARRGDGLPQPHTSVFLEHVASLFGESECSGTSDAH
ncbi:MAG: hypothetical protein H6822_07650 [Planctomycetaceae bacterium]|nr:hypothetical protein [Planctomycetales bacterium]MCB9922039.1 hypothetical protein [Planctomycetaceae bacterium]